MREKLVIEAPSCGEASNVGWGKSRHFESKARGEGHPTRAARPSCEALDAELPSCMENEIQSLLQSRHEMSRRWSNADVVVEMETEEERPREDPRTALGSL
jgi:hypothetical protein